jgi:hypothetical protein
MIHLAYPEVKLIVDERIRKAERRHLAAEVRSPGQPSRVGRLFGLRRPIFQGV